jgi:nickel-dependent lactate racemase
VVIVISDHTRPVPDKLLVPETVSALGARDSAVTILVGTGTHRPSTGAELEAKLGPGTLRRFKVVNHDCSDTQNLRRLGAGSLGGEIWLNKIYTDADVKVCTGFIEPHFFAGFSGGAKSLVPGIAGLETIRHFHCARMIADPMSTWAELKNNPLQKFALEAEALAPPDFILNVTLNAEKKITGVFAGETRAAHSAACARAAEEALTPVKRRFPIVITSNSGYPLDQNFYQTVKGISAASRVVEDGGAVIIASECSAGMPPEGEFTEILSEKISNEELLKKILASEKVIQDQWQVQTLLQCLKKSRIFLFSALAEETARLTRTERTSDIMSTVESLRAARGGGRTDIAVMPLGPLTVPVASP